MLQVERAEMDHNHRVDGTNGADSRRFFVTVVGRKHLAAKSRVPLQHCVAPDEEENEGAEGEIMQLQSHSAMDNSRDSNVQQPQQSLQEPWADAALCLMLIRELHNPRDPLAIRVARARLPTPEIEMLGHLPARLAACLAPLLDLRRVCVVSRLCNAEAVEADSQCDALAELFVLHQPSPTSAASLSSSSLSSSSSAAATHSQLPVLLPPPCSRHDNDRVRHYRLALDECIEWLQTDHTHRFVQNFHVISAVAFTSFHHLFLDCERASLRCFLSLSLEAQHLFCRLMLRKQASSALLADAIMAAAASPASSSPSRLASFAPAVLAWPSRWFAISSLHYKHVSDLHASIDELRVARARIDHQLLREQSLPPLDAPSFSTAVPTGHDAAIDPQLSPTFPSALLHQHAVAQKCAFLSDGMLMSESQREEIERTAAFMQEQRSSNSVLAPTIAVHAFTLDIASDAPLSQTSDEPLSLPPRARQSSTSLSSYDGSLWPDEGFVESSLESTLPPFHFFSSILACLSAPQLRRFCQDASLRVALSGPQQQLKKRVLHTLSTQRTLQGNTLFEEPRTRAALPSEMLRLTPRFLALCQRLHRLFFLSEDVTPVSIASAASPMTLEDLGKTRWCKPMAVSARPSCSLPSSVHSSSCTSAALHSAASRLNSPCIARSLSLSSDTAPSSSCWDVHVNSSPQRDSIFPTRATFLAYDRALHVKDCMSFAIDDFEAEFRAGSLQLSLALCCLAHAWRALESEQRQPDSSLELEFHPSRLLFERHRSTRKDEKKRETKQKSSSIKKGSNKGAVKDEEEEIGSEERPPFLQLTDEDLTRFFDAFHPHQESMLSSSSSSASSSILSSRSRSSSTSAPSPTPAFVLRYRASWIYAEICHYGVAVLERAHFYREATWLLFALLETPFCTNRRGYWFNRLALNLAQHQRNFSQARRVARLGLADARVRTGERAELEQRVRRASKQCKGDQDKVEEEEMEDPGNGSEAVAEELKTDRGMKRMSHQEVLDLCSSEDEAMEASPQQGSKRKIVAGLRGRGGRKKRCKISSTVATPSSSSIKPPHLSLQKSALVSSVTIQGRPLNREIGVKSRFVSRAGECCSVEELALEFYALPENGAWRGEHCENALLMTLFGLLMWDVIWLPMPRVFHSDYQTGPLDLDTDDFYASRAAAIDRRVEELATGDITEQLRQSYWDHRFQRCRGVQWRRWSCDELEERALAIGNRSLAAICHIIARDFSHWQGGLPDLFLWKVNDEKEEPIAANAKNVARKPDSQESQQKKQMKIVHDGLSMRSVCARLVEVKGPRDRLSYQQRAWLDQLAPHIPVECCFVKENFER